MTNDEVSKHEFDFVIGSFVIRASSALPLLLTPPRGSAKLPPLARLGALFETAESSQGWERIR